MQTFCNKALFYAGCRRPHLSAKAKFQCLHPFLNADMRT